jgi:hypothetical protein
VGVRIKARSNQETSSLKESEITNSNGANKKLTRSERFSKKLMTSTQGYARYKIIDESIATLGDHKVMTMEASVMVCVPLQSVMKDVLFIQSALNSRNQELIEFRAVLINAFNSHPLFQIANINDDDVDAIVDGKITEISVQDIDGSNDSIVNSMLKKDKFKRIRVGVVVTANYGDSDIISINHEMTKTILDNINVEDAINSFAPDVLKEGVTKLINQILKTHNVSGQYSSGSSAASNREKPKW